MTEITISFEEFINGLEGADKGSTRYIELENAWNAFHEKVEMAYYNWNQYVNLDLNPNLFDCFSPSDDACNRRTAAKAYIYGYLMNLHAAYDSLPFLLNKAYQLGTKDERCCWDGNFKRKLENQNPDVFNTIEELYLNEWFAVLKAVVNQWKHRDRPTLMFSLGKQFWIKAIEYRYEGNTCVKDINVDDLMKNIHNELHFLVFQALRTNNQ